MKERRVSRYVSIDDLEQAVDVVRAAAESKACSISGGGGGEGIGGGACSVFSGLNGGSSSSLPGGGLSGLGRRILKYLQGLERKKKEACTSSSRLSSDFSSPKGGEDERGQEVQRSQSSSPPHFHVQLPSSTLSSSPPLSVSCSSSPPSLSSSQSKRRPSCLFSHDQETTSLFPYTASTMDTSMTSQREYFSSSFRSDDEEMPCRLDVYPPTSRLIYGRERRLSLEDRYTGWRRKREEEKETAFFDKPRERRVPSFSSSPPPPPVSTCCCLSIAEMYVSPLFVRPIASILHLLFSKHEELLFDSLQLLLKRDSLLPSFTFSSSPMKTSSLSSSFYSSPRKIKAHKTPLDFFFPPLSEKKPSQDEEARDDNRRSLHKDVVFVDAGIEERERKDMKEKTLYGSDASLGYGENRSMYERPTSLVRERHLHQEAEEREIKRKRSSWREQGSEGGGMDRKYLSDIEMYRKGLEECSFQESSSTFSPKSGLVADVSTCSSLYEEGGSVSRLTSFSVEPCRSSTQKEDRSFSQKEEEEKGEGGKEEDEKNGGRCFRGEGREGERNEEGEEGRGLSVQLNHHHRIRTSCSSFPFRSSPSVFSPSISFPSSSYVHSSSSSLFSFPPASRRPTTPSLLLEGQLARVYKRVSTVSPRPKWIVLRGAGGGDRGMSGVSSVYGAGGTGGRGRSAEKKKEGGEELEGYFPLSVLKRFLVPGLLDALQVSCVHACIPSFFYVYIGNKIYGFHPLKSGQDSPPFLSSLDETYTRLLSCLYTSVAETF